MTGLFYSGGELAVAQRIQQERIDVLINLAGHTRANDMVTKICAYRPAPVQMLHLGYAGSMGRNLVDLHVTDRFGIPFTFSLFIISCITSTMVPHASSDVTAARFSSPVEFRRHYDEALLYAMHYNVLNLSVFGIIFATVTCPGASSSTTICSLTAGCHPGWFRCWDLECFLSISTNVAFCSHFRQHCILRSIGSRAPAAP
jgi:hypothetical protein